MGSCSRRHFLLSVCVLQLLFVIERQVFDFLGYMWAPILANFFHIIFVIFGFFGAYQYRPKYLITYSLWNLLWIGWNIFLICFYLNIGILDRDSDILNLGTGSVSWFEVNGYGCKPVYPMNITSEDPYRPVRPERVDGCLLDYHIVEIAQSGVQSILALLGLFGAICLGHTYLDEDDSFDFMGGDAKSPQHTAVHPMYVSYTSLPTTTNSATSTQLKQAVANSAAKPVATPIITANYHNNSSSTHCLSNTSAKLGVVLKSINGHGSKNQISSSNTNTLLSSSSSPSSTFTNCNGTGSIGNNNSGRIPQASALAGVGQTHETHIPLHQQPQLPHPLSRNSSFSRTRSGQLRKNSSSSVNIRFTDVTHQQQPQQQRHPSASSIASGLIPNDDDTFFIPKSSSCRANFGFINPFNNGPPNRLFKQNGEGDSDSRADDDDDTDRLITGSTQQLSLSTPLRRHPSVTSTGNNNVTTSASSGTTTPMNDTGSYGFERINFTHGTRPDFGPFPQQPHRAGPGPASSNSRSHHQLPSPPVQSIQPPPVPPLPQLHHYQQQQQPDSPDAYRLPYQYVTRSPNLNRIARRNNLINNNNSNSNSNTSNGYSNNNSNSSSGSNTPRVMSPKYCDQIRELSSAGSPGYPNHENNNRYPPPPPSAMVVGGAGQPHHQYPAMLIHRAKSQDRLAHRSRRQGPGGSRGQFGGHHQQQRPRSFCSNNGAYPDYVIMEHPGS
ncbi:sodium/potassium-transporting ATPase subunit beta-1-interacting protein isoform X1 [Uranotaenia lowii]|uniref:sodium/potassium-transporting ATPase subunit beta-1-interacting protein isoform X1 n=1 Tax=Uranotaenia lowii TaxID=190385 RepID=UPI0024793EBD|nr:sodium/potassium-transporting ATPase subunit beta-1-interacting protein isoform X1 [Uranotaenia lowii]